MGSCSSFLCWCCRWSGKAWIKTFKYCSSSRPHLNLFLNDYCSILFLLVDWSSTHPTAAQGKNSQAKACARKTLSVFSNNSRCNCKHSTAVSGIAINYTGSTTLDSTGMYFHVARKSDVSFWRVDIRVKLPLQGGYNEVYLSSVSPLSEQIMKGGYFSPPM